MEQAAAIWEDENEEDDEVVDRATSSTSFANPWFLYEAGIICSGKLMEVLNATHQERVCST